MVMAGYFGPSGCFCAFVPLLSLKHPVKRSKNKGEVDKCRAYAMQYFYTTCFCLFSRKGQTMHFIFFVHKKAIVTIMMNCFMIFLVCFIHLFLAKHTYCSFFRAYCLFQKLYCRANLSFIQCGIFLFIFWMYNFSIFSLPVSPLLISDKASGQTVEPGRRTETHLHSVWRSYLEVSRGILDCTLSTFG